MTARISSVARALRRALSRKSAPRRSTHVVNANGQGHDTANQPDPTGPSAKWLALG